MNTEDLKDMRVGRVVRAMLGAAGELVVYVVLPLTIWFLWVFLLHKGIGLGKLSITLIGLVCTVVTYVTVMMIVEWIRTTLSMAKVGKEVIAERAAQAELEASTQQQNPNGSSLQGAGGDTTAAGPR
jgi:hypothetical protein